MSQPEVWLRGPLSDYSPTLMPVAHALLQASEDLGLAAPLSFDKLWQKSGQAASIGFHLKHIAGSTERLLTYAQGQQLSLEQLAFLKNEAVADKEVDVLISEARAAIDKTLTILKTTPDSALYEPRSVGRQGLPSTVIGLLYHIGEHTSRHVGQIITTVKTIS